jgi:hypothetical protein
MSDYVSSQKTLSVTYDSDIEVITPTLQKIQFTSSGRVQLSRPDKLRAARTGGYSDVEIVFDGKTLTVNNKDGNAFAQMESSGSVDQLIDTLRDKHGIAAPGADLLFSQPFDVMMADVIEMAHVGQVLSTASSVSTWHFETRTPTGRSGSRPALDRSRASMSSPPRP